MTPEQHYRRLYFEAYDLIIECIKKRFDQPGYAVYSRVEDLILKTMNHADYRLDFEFVTDFYGSDFDAYRLESQLEVFAAMFDRENHREPFQMQDALDFMRTRKPPQREQLSEVCKLFQLLLVMPATNAESERAFSSLRRVKSYLRSTMSQERLNHLMVLHIHKDRTDSLNAIDIANDFVSGSDHRQQIFGKFKTSDL